MIVEVEVERAGSATGAETPKEELELATGVEETEEAAEARVVVPEVVVGGGEGATRLCQVEDRLDSLNPQQCFAHSLS
jgi:hypothetical protein